MLNSSIIFDINGANGVIAISQASVNPQSDTMEITQQVINVEGSMTLDIAMLSTVGNVLTQLADNDLRERISIIIPERVALRTFQALKAKKAGRLDTLEQQLWQSWMAKDSQKANWENGIADFCEGFRAYQGSVNFVNARQLYRYEVVSGDEKGENLRQFNGVEVEFTASVNKEHELSVRDNNMINGKFKITVSEVRDRDGNSRYRAFIDRYVTVEVEKDGKKEQRRVTAYEASTLWECEAINDRGAALINGLRLHVKSAEVLPRMKTVKKLVVNQQKG